MTEISQWLWVILVAMLPIFELRGAIPLALGVYDLDPYIAIPLIIVANFIPVPFIIYFLEPVENYFRRWQFFETTLDKIFRYTHNRTRKRIEKWESIALIFFVAIPLPVTGAWTGSLAAYLFGLDYKKSLLFILLGICVAAVIVTTAVVAGINLLL